MRPFVPALLALSLAAAPSPVASQDLTTLATACAGTEAGLTAWCQELALGAAAIQRAVGLASGLGSPVPGSSSTLGLRLGSTPRVTAAVAPMWVRVAFPDLTAGDGTAVPQAGKASAVGFRTSAAVGLVDGWQLAPTVGGVLSVDLLADWTWVRFPNAEGFDGGGSGLGVGARLGVFRESFTLPGVSVSVMQRWPGALSLGGVDPGAGGVEVDGSVTSVRATVGKNLFAVGLLAGYGWDRYDGDVSLAASAPDGLGGSITGTATGGLTQERRLYFVSGWFNFLITQLAVEAGLADGFEHPFTGRTGGFEPTDRTFFMTAAFRITI